MLSDLQRQIAHDAAGKVVVRACPGSGKTFSVAARVASKVNTWNRPNQGLAVVSFTNVAWEEIEAGLARSFQVPGPLGYPHFLGTIDSFVNKYIFLPYGHLVMGCPRRPVLVGPPHSAWNVRRYDTDYHQYFGIVSYGATGELIYPEIQDIFFFNYRQMYNQNGDESGHARNLRSAKQTYWELGYANQHDANYFAMRLLETYPQIAQALVTRFPEWIVDEAQDTNEVQMRILDILIAHGLNEIMLVGDPDQAIFEWNKAKPELFARKFEEWRDNSIVLNENRRSSQAICNSTFHLSTLDQPSTAVADDIKDFGVLPEIVVYSEQNIQATIDYFLQKCEQLGIGVTREKVAVLCRSNGLVGRILGRPTAQSWTSDHTFTYPLAHASFLFTRAKYKRAFQIVEKVVFHIHSPNSMVDSSTLEAFRKQRDFFDHRQLLYDFLRMLPPAIGPVGDWIERVNGVLHRRPVTINEVHLVPFEQLFVTEEIAGQGISFRLGNVHSAKGETFDAVLLFLKTKGLGQAYTTMLAQNTSSANEEELRIIYVGLTRPRKYLLIAAPNGAHQGAWQRKLLE